MRPVVLLRRLCAAWGAAGVFEDRRDAARELIDRLAEYRGRHPLVLGIPRGAVPMARLVADALEGEVDVVLVRKLGAPGNPEFAIGAVDESGVSRVTGDAASAGAGADYIEAETRRQREILRQRRALYTVQRAPIDPGGRIVIVLDDGLATGSTMIAALQSLRRRGPSRLICAVPVAPPETAEKVAENCDELVCLRTPADFYAVGQFYRHFPQVTDDEVVAALAGASAPQSPAKP